MQLTGEVKIRSKDYNDRKVVKYDYSIGDLVMIEQVKKNPLDLPRKGPCKVISVRDGVTYLLEDENGKQFERHVSLIYPFILRSNNSDNSSNLNIGKDKNDISLEMHEIKMESNNEKFNNDINDSNLDDKGKEEKIDIDDKNYGIEINNKKLGKENNFKIVKEKMFDYGKRYFINNEWKHKDEIPKEILSNYQKEKREIRSKRRKFNN